jgi:hypothetical protein
MSASDEGEEPDDGPEAPHPYRGPAYAKPSLAQVLQRSTLLQCSACQRISCL